MSNDPRDKIIVKQRNDLTGSPWQVDIIMVDGIKRHLIDTPAELNRILMLPRGERD